MEISKEELAKGKASVDDKNLDYQNYLYQNENIVSQINTCINYPAPELVKLNLLEGVSII